MCKTGLRARTLCALSLWALLPLSSITSLTGCEAQNDSATPEQAEGEASIVALALSATDITHVSVIITGPTGGALTTPITVSLQHQVSQWSGVASRLPVGSGYRFALSATDANGTVLYSGSASGVSIVKGQTAHVVITAQQANPPSPFANAAPIIDSVIASTARVAPGESISLTANAHDPNAEDTISYTWTAAAGSFSAPSASTTNWTAPSSVGTFPLTLSIRDPHGATVTVQIQAVVAANSGVGSAEISAVLNTWPVVTNLAALPTYLEKSGKSLITAQASDPDGDSLVYSWSSSCAGSFGEAKGPTPSFTLDAAEAANQCSLSVTVSDGRGGSASGTLVLPVGKPTVATAPAITVVTQSATTVDANETIRLAVRATDPQNLPLTFSWTASEGALSAQLDTSGSSEVSWTAPATAATNWTITATATDSLGIPTPYSFSVRPSSCFGSHPREESSWSFAVMGDTQWTMADDGKNPNSVAVDIIAQLNAQFIAQGVKFVVAVGDITDNGTRAAIDTRAVFAQPLYDAGIGFFPLRGNHESSKTAAAEFVRVFPQTRTGQQNATPSDAFVPNADDPNTLPRPSSGTSFALGASYSSPSAALTGLSYAFDYGNARLVLLDQFTPADGSTNTIDAQQKWIDSTLSTRPANTHAFVFAHKGIITEDHQDTLFGSDPSKAPASQDAFIASLERNGVRYFIGGHDHMHNRAIVTTTDGKSAKLQDIIVASASSKFYAPANPSNDAVYNLPAFGITRETPISQELYTIGYYIVTITGERAHVDFYSAPANPDSGNISTTPVLNFTKRESFGYGQNGKQFVIAPRGSYDLVGDTFGSTTAHILSGTNASPGTDGSGRQFSKTVDTAWSSATCETSSAILSLSITGALGTGQTDTYALSMSYDSATSPADSIARGGFGIATKDAKGNWRNAVELDFGGERTFVLGPYQASYPLGSYGVDVATNTAWAVLNYSSQFAVTAFPK